MLNFQEMIAKLTQFWVEQGCLAHEGYDLEVGAGTFNPATFLRALGPEPYSAVYVEPSRRPQDGRYGENPNRLQHYHQMQVIMKPSPSNIQALYLKSLEYIGLNLKEHDIRFVHDDWENPTIGAAGLGWEIWLDGMEVTQFTYFQVIGGLPVRPVTGEITYGLERLAMYIQNVNSFFDLKWNDEILYGEIFKRSEFEWSHYNFSEADIALWSRHFDDFEREAHRLIGINLPLPAYDFIMKASHAFNILEARGVISVTERTGYIGRIRDLARELAHKYIAVRQNLNFPLLKEKATVSPSLPSLPSFAPDQLKEREDFLLEIGSEELPHSFVPIGLRQIEKEVKNFLAKVGLEHGKITTYGTPRRIAILVEGLGGATAPQQMEKKGPSLAIAFDEKGDLSKAGEAFILSLSLKGEEKYIKEKVAQNHYPRLFLREIKGQSYLFGLLEEAGQSTRALLSAEIPKIVKKMEFPKKMRWGSFDLEYARPLRWIVALYGSEVIPCTMADVVSDRITYGHPLISPRPIALSSAKEYVDRLRDHHVMVDVEERKARILEEIKLQENLGNFRFLQVEKLLPQVTHLVEYPFLLLGSFDACFLKAPKEVLISEMVEHQKYFPIEKDGLSHQFGVVTNNFVSEKIRQGNERALSPRLADGLFLYEEDLKEPLVNYNEKLKTIIFQKEAGTLYAKVTRLVVLVEKLYNFLPIGDLKKLQRAALLCKADISTELVREFPELQGILGEHYALKSGEDSEVAKAINEHWMPRGENAPLPQSATGIILSLAEKIDNLVTCFALNLIPTSSSDPYALRRQALGLIKILLHEKQVLPLRQFLEAGLDIFLQNKQLSQDTVQQVIQNRAQIIASLEEFIKNRFKNFLQEAFPKDEVEAIVEKTEDFTTSYLQLVALHAFRQEQSASFLKLLQASTRIRKILASQEATSFNEADLIEEAEKALFAKVVEIKKALPHLMAKQLFGEAFSLLATLADPLDHFFNTVKVMEENSVVRNNRLALLQEIALLTESMAHLEAIQKL